MIKDLLMAMGRALPMSFSGGFVVLGTSPRSTATRTVTVPAGNPGILRFDSVAFDTTTFQYSKNSGTLTNVTNGDTITLANGDTLSFRATGSAGNNAACSLFDVAASQTIGFSVSITIS